MTESCPHTPMAISQLQTHADTIYGDPEYTWDEYIQS